MLDLKFAVADPWLPPALDTANPDIELWRDNDGTICAYGGSLNGTCWMHLPGVATFNFSDANSQIVATADASVARDRIVDAYYRTVLPLALQTRGIEVLHASAVSMHGGIVALCGIKETGKSTIAYALSRRGHSLRADDAVPFTRSGDVMQALSLPFTMRLRPASAAFFGRNGMSERNSPHADAQGLVLLAPELLTPERLAAVFVLERNSSALSTTVPSINRLVGAPAFLSALTHAYCFSPNNGEQTARMVQHYLDLAANIPIFEIRFGAGLRWLPAITSAIEEMVAAVAA